MITNAKNNRIDMQYYIGKEIDEKLFDYISIEDFCEKSEKLVQNLTKADVSKIRSALQLFQCLK